MGSELWSHRMICVLLLLLLLLVVGPHVLQKVKSAHGLFSLYPPPSFFFFLSLRSLQHPYKGIRRTQPSSTAALQGYPKDLQGYPKDPTVLYNRPTRESPGPLLSTAAAPQVIQRNHALSAAALRGV